MNMLLSSRLTFAWKFILPVLWGAWWSYDTALLFTDPSQVHWGPGGTPPAWAKWLSLAFLLLGGFVFWRVCYPLKRVMLQDGQLRISNFLHEIVVPLADVKTGGFEQGAEIDESVSLGLGPVSFSVTRRRPLVALELRRDTRFGRLIEFLPRSTGAMDLLESQFGQAFARPDPVENRKTDEYAEELRGRGTV